MSSRPFHLYANALNHLRSVPVRQRSNKGHAGCLRRKLHEFHPGWLILFVSNKDKFATTNQWTRTAWRGLKIQEEDHVQMIHQKWQGSEHGPKGNQILTMFWQRRDLIFTMFLTMFWSWWRGAPCSKNKAFEGPQGKPKKDYIDLFGMLVSAELRKLGHREQRVARYQIKNLLFTMQI